MTLHHLLRKKNTIKCVLKTRDLRKQPTTYIWMWIKIKRDTVTTLGSTFFNLFSLILAYLCHYRNAARVMSRELVTERREKMCTHLSILSRSSVVTSGKDMPTRTHRCIWCHLCSFPLTSITMAYSSFSLEGDGGHWKKAVWWQQGKLEKAMAMTQKQWGYTQHVALRIHTTHRLHCWFVHTTHSTTNFTSHTT